MDHEEFLKSFWVPNALAGTAAPPPPAFRFAGSALDRGAGGGPGDTGTEMFRVAVRIRPVLKGEDGEAVWPSEGKGDDPHDAGPRVTVCAPGPDGAAKRQSFRFHDVYGPAASQEEVYTRTVQPCVASALGGYNATVFAYG